MNPAGPRRARRAAALAAVALLVLIGALLLWVPGPASVPARDPDIRLEPDGGQPTDPAERAPLATYVGASQALTSATPLAPPSPPECSPDPAGDGSTCQLSLRVVDDSGMPISATVAHGPAYVAGQPEAWTSTTAEGLWRSRVPLQGAAQAWQIVARAPGHRPNSLVVPFLPEGALDLGELRLCQALRVEGRVLAAAGGPLPGARVQLLGVRRSVSHSAVRALSDMALSDDQGDFALDVREVTPGYDLMVSAWHADAGGPFEAPLGDPAEGPLEPITLRFGESTSVRGYVARRDGTRLAGVTVSPHLPPQFALADVVTDADGRYAIPLAAGRTVKLTYRGEGLVPLDPEAFSVSAPARDVDLLMVLESTLRLDVRDALDGAPVPSVQVSFCSDSWGYGRCHEASGVDGWLEHRGLPPGTWSRLIVSAQGYQAQGLPDQLVAEGQVVGPLLVRLSPLTAEAVASGQVLGERGRPLSGVVVSAVVTQDGLPDTEASTLSGVDGSFRIGPLPSGELTLLARDDQDRQAEPLTGTLTSSGWHDITLRLEPPVTLDGQAWLSVDQPAAGALLRLAPSGRPGPATPDPLSAVTDDQGRFRLSARPGRYRLSAWMRLPGQAETLESPVRLLELAAGEQRWMDVPLTLRALSVGGRVRADEPTAGWSLTWRHAASLFEADWTEVLVEAHQASVGAASDYLLEGVRPGVYEVSIQREDDSLVTVQDVRVETSLEPLVTIDLHVPDGDG